MPDTTNPGSKKRVRRREDRYTACVWPGCTARRQEFFDLPIDMTPLCGYHLSIATQLEARMSKEIVASMRRDIEAARAARPKPKPAPKPQGVVYFVQSGGHIKIGWTSDLAKRMRAYPPGSVLMAVMPGDRSEEARLHRKFAVHRTHGREWYPLAAEITRFIDQVVAEHGEPPAVDFAGKRVEVPRPHQLSTTARPKGWARHRG